MDCSEDVSTFEGFSNEEWRQASRKTSKFRAANSYRESSEAQLNLANRFSVFNTYEASPSEQESSKTSKEKNNAKYNELPRKHKNNRESQVTTNRNMKIKYSKLHLFCDSQGRKLGAKLSQEFSDVEVCSFVKPNAPIKDIVKSVDPKCYSENDYVVFAGTNDASTNQSENIISSIHENLDNLKQTNVIVIDVPHRFDLSRSSYENQKIDETNCVLFNIGKNFKNVNMISSNNLDCSNYTRHGFHLNSKGKQVLSRKISRIMIF